MFVTILSEIFCYSFVRQFQTMLAQSTLIFDSSAYDLWIFLRSIKKLAMLSRSENNDNELSNEFTWGVLISERFCTFSKNRSADLVQEMSISNVFRRRKATAISYFPWPSNSLSINFCLEQDAKREILINDYRSNGFSCGASDIRK